MKHIIFMSILLIAGCVVVPKTDNAYVARCKVSTDKMTLKVIDVAKETSSFYSVSGLLLTPILYPASALLSGTYVAVNNVYNIGEEKLVCE